MAEPMTWPVLALTHSTVWSTFSYLCNICGNDGGLSKKIQDDSQPSGQMLSTVLGQVQPSDAAKLDAKRLQKDGEQIRHQNDEQVSVLGFSTRLYIRGIVPGVDVGDLRVYVSIYGSYKQDV